jgi:CRP-like cAMP-binding protein
MSSLDEQTNLIRGLPLMARLGDDDLQALAATGRTARYDAGATLFRQGDTGDALYVIVDGRLRVEHTSPAGDDSTLALMGPGEACGDLSLLDGRPRSASAIAVEPTSALVISRSAFVRWVSERPSAALAVLETLSLLVRRKDEALTELAFLDLSRRLARRLLDLVAMAAQQPERKESNGIWIKVTQAEIGAMLGVTRESVNKELNGFARQGWVMLGRGSVSVQSVDALRLHAIGADDA